MFKIIILCLFCLYLTTGNAKTSINSLPLDIQKIIHIESSGNPFAISHANARGLMQITSITLLEYNQRCKTNYTENDLFNPEINIKIGTWYWNIRIPQMLIFYGLKDNINNRIISYNAGIGNCIKYHNKTRKLKEETLQYFVKFRK